MGTKRLPSGHCTQTVCPASDLYIFANIFADCNKIKTKNNEQMQSQKWFHFGELWTL